MNIVTELEERKKLVISKNLHYRCRHDRTSACQCYPHTSRARVRTYSQLQTLIRRRWQLSQRSFHMHDHLKMHP